MSFENGIGMFREFGLYMVCCIDIRNISVYDDNIVGGVMMIF